MKPQSFAPEILRSIQKIRAKPEDVREDKILGLPLTQQLRRMLLVGLEQSVVVFRVELADDAIIQVGC